MIDLRRLVVRFREEWLEVLHVVVLRSSAWVSRQKPDSTHHCLRLLQRPALLCVGVHLGVRVSRVREGRRLPRCLAGSQGRYWGVRLHRRVLQRQVIRYLRMMMRERRAQARARARRTVAQRAQRVMQRRRVRAHRLRHGMPPVQQAHVQIEVRLLWLLLMRLLMMVCRRVP